jgi:OOP family OmpA-OmpF porin
MGDRGAEMASLRAELLGPEQRRLAALQARLDNRLARAEDLAEVLPTVLQQHANDPYLARALTPPLEQAITASVRRNPKPLADALFPVMGPAIRKAVAASLAAMVDSLSRTLEHSLSWRSLQWRARAWRTGKSFAEVVLIETLLYRVEQVFLIDRRTGLLLQHVRAGTGGVEDADLVSGMLTAIRDFVQDSFRVRDSEALESLQVGELSVWIETGPQAILAAVIRGTAPRAYRRVLQDALEIVHLQFGTVLEAFDGETRVFDGTRPVLEACLESEVRATHAAPRRRLVWSVLALVLAALLVWGGFAWRTARRETRYLEALRAEPGVVVLSASHSGGRLVVSGLRDPLARDPQTLVAASGLAPEDVTLAWTPYYALAPSVVVARARAALQPPPGVEFTLEDGVLGATGAAPAAWIADTRRLAPLVAGVDAFDATGVVDGATGELARLLGSAALLFVTGTPTPVPGQDAAVAALEREIDALAALADSVDARFRLDVVGHTDEDGAEAANLPLSQQRAAFVTNLLRGRAGPRIDIVASGVGSTEPAVPGRTAADKQRNRRVSFRVTRLDGIR